MDQKIVSLYGQIGVTILAQLTFAGVVLVSFFLRDTNLMLMVVGAAIANATSTINFWTGSSSGSQKKDEALGVAAVKPENSNGRQEQSVVINNDPQKEGKP